MTAETVSRPPGSIVVAQLAFIGDMVFTTPLLEVLRGVWPEAAITVVGRPRALEVLEDHPAVSALTPYDKDAAGEELSGFLRLAREIRAQRPDLFIGVTRSGRTALLARVSGAPVRVGFNGFLRRLAYNRLVEREEGRPLTERPLALLSALGLRSDSTRLSLAVGPRRREEARSALLRAGWRGGPLLTVAPGAHYATKRWPEGPLGRFLELVLADGRMQPALYGGAAESQLIERLLSGRPGVIDRRDLAVGALTAEFVFASVFVGGDSGPAHIARALGRPTVILFGPTDQKMPGEGDFTAVFRDLPCRPCSPHGDDACPLGHHACLAELPPETVLAAVRRALGPNGA